MKDLFGKDVGHPFEDLVVDLEKVDLRQAIIFPELVGLSISVNDILDIVHHTTDVGLMSDDIKERYKDDPILLAYIDGYNKGLQSADVVIRSNILTRFKKK